MHIFKTGQHLLLFNPWHPDEPGELHLHKQFP